MRSSKGHREPLGNGDVVLTRDLDPETVLKMVQVDLASLTSEPDSEIESFQFHGCTGGVSAFRGRPPWEKHGEGDELLLILAGRTQLTVLEDGAPSIQDLSMGQLAIVPSGLWHSNDAPDGVTMLWLTPPSGNEHSWEPPKL
jgi:mannose-6-phosphate isomerase-like protein (cupin superfamily)